MKRGRKFKSVLEMLEFISLKNIYNRHLLMYTSEYIKTYQEQCRFYMDEFYEREIQLKWSRRIR